MFASLDRSSRSSSQKAPRLIVGREEEKRKIRQSLAEFGNGDKRAIIITGEIGSGISTLGSYLKTEAQNMNYIVCHGEASEINRKTPFYVFQDIIFDIVANVHRIETSNASRELSFQNILNVSAAQSSFLTTANPIDTIREDSDDSVEFPSPVITATTGSSGSAAPPQTHFKTLGFQPRPKSQYSQKVGEFHALSGEDITRGASASFSKKILSHDFADDRPSAVSKISLRRIQHRSSIASYNNLLMKPTMGSHEKSLSALENTEHNQFKGHIQDALQELLTAIGMNKNLVPLFGIIFPVEFNETKDSSLFQGRVRLRELKSVLVRILNIISRNMPWIVVFEETQWIDYLSWNLVNDILQECENILVCLITHNQFSSESDKMPLEKLAAIQNMPTTSTITLKNMDVTSLAVVLSQYLRELICKQVEFDFLMEERIKDIVQAVVPDIYQRSNGSPLYAKYIILYSHRLLCQSSETPAFETSPIFKEAAWKALEIPAQMSTIILDLFNALPEGLQDFLHIASVFGEQFFLEDVLFLLNEDDYETQFTESSIMLGDVFEFLRKETDDANGVIFCFRSSLIRTVIYQDMSESVRAHHHLQLAHKFEVMTDNSNNIRMLIPIYEHYSKTNETIKSISYLEQICLFFFETRSIEEAIVYFHLLLDTTKTCTASNAQDSIRHSSWRRFLSESYYALANYTEASKYITEAMQVLGFKIPSTNLEIFFMTSRLWFRRVFDLKANFIDTIEPDLLSEFRLNFVTWMEILYSMENLKSFKVAIALSSHMNKFASDMDQVSGRLLAFQTIASWKLKEHKPIVWAKLDKIQDMVLSGRDQIELENCATIGYCMCEALFMAGSVIQSWRKSSVLLQYSELVEDCRIWNRVAFIRMWSEKLMAQSQEQSDTKYAVYLYERMKNSSNFGNRCTASIVFISTARFDTPSRAEVFSEALIKLNALGNDPVFLGVHRVIQFNFSTTLASAYMKWLRYKTASVLNLEINFYDLCETVMCMTQKFGRHQWHSLFGTISMLEFIYDVYDLIITEDWEVLELFHIKENETQRLVLCIQALCDSLLKNSRKLSVMVVSRSVTLLLEGAKSMFQALVQDNLRNLEKTNAIWSKCLSDLDIRQFPFIVKIVDESLSSREKLAESASDYSLVKSQRSMQMPTKRQ